MVKFGLRSFWMIPLIETWQFTFAGRFIIPYPTPAMTPIVKIKVGTSGLRVARQSPMQDTILPAKRKNMIKQKEFKICGGLIIVKLGFKELFGHHKKYPWKS